MSESINQAVIENVCKILGELTSGYKITMMFKTLNFYDTDIIQFGKAVSTKWKRYDTIIYECNHQHSARPFFQIIEYIMKPIDFVDSPAALARKSKGY